jgi:tRNA-specific 2-thiouridylase
MKIALSLGADYVATGHYCRKSQTEVNGSTVYQLRAGADKKDQSYLPIITRTIIKIFISIGELTKPEVREIAAQMELVTAEKRTQGLCFIGKVRLPEFYKNYSQKKGQLFKLIKMMAYMRFKSKKVVSRGGIVISFE